MIRPFLLAAVLALRALPALAAAPSVYLEELTWTEVRDAIRSGMTTVIVPVGGTEQSGPDIALGKHDARARALAGQIAAALGNALVAPVVDYVPEGTLNPPAGHMRFPGTITVPEEAFEKVVESAARSFRLHGFTDIVLIGDHGGYQSALGRVAARLDREWAASHFRVHAIGEYYRASTTGFAEILEARGFSKAEIGEHAGLADASLTLALAPGLVRIDRLAAGTRGAADGVRGDARRASAQLGQLGVDLIVRRTVVAIGKAVARR